VPIEFERRGHGPVMYVHPGGPGLSSAEFGDDFAGLEHIFELVLIDPRGTGRSGTPPDPRAYSLDDYVADLTQIIPAGVPPVMLLGFSHGGLVAQQFAAHFGRRISALVLASTAARFSDETISAMDKHIESKRGEAWFDSAMAALKREQAGDFQDAAELGTLLAQEMPLYFHTFDARAQAYTEKLREHGCNPNALRYFNEVEFRKIDLRPELARITTRTLIIAGDCDFICPPEATRELHESIKGSELVTIPESGHMTFVEQPEAFAAACARLQLHG
jgi:proline iminopeptidase